jgi:hypothetical protein
MSVELEDRVTDLETVLARFIIQTERTISRLEKSEQSFQREMRAESRAANKRWGEIANSLGRLVEDIAAPNLSGVAKTFFGCEGEPDFFATQVKKVHSKDKTKRREFDVVAAYNDIFIINETKSRAKIEYIQDFQKALEDWQNYFPEYVRCKIIPVFCSLYVPNDALSYLTKSKIYAMGMGADNMTILNPELDF